MYYLFMSNFNYLKLAGAIAESGKSQNELSEQLGVHYNTISAWVNGRADPTPLKLFDTLRAIGWQDNILKDQFIVDWYFTNGNQES